MNLAIKVLGYPDVIRTEHSLSVSTYRDLDSWISTNVDTTGRYEVSRAGSAHVLTDVEFNQLRQQTNDTLVLHVRPQPGTERSVPPTSVQLLKPGSEEAKAELEKVGDLLAPCCEAFLSEKGRAPRLLIIGKQHQSSSVNHFKRCLSGEMDVPNEVEVAPGGAMETTLYSQCVTIKFREWSFDFGDMPALANMDGDRKQDLKEALRCMRSGFERGGKTRKKCTLEPNPPDAAIIVVSLEEERESLSSYLKELQGVLKSQAESKASFPFVVALTHKDKFLKNGGNIKEAVAHFRELANTQAVFTITNYEDSSWWDTAVTESTYRMLRQATNLGKNREPAEPESGRKDGTLNKPTAWAQWLWTILRWIAVILAAWCLTFPRDLGRDDAS